MYCLRTSLVQQLDKSLFSFAFDLWDLMQQECGMCLQGSSYCWNMWVLLPGDISEDCDCADSGRTSWMDRVDVGKETGPRVCNLQRECRAWCSPSPPHPAAIPWLQLDLTPFLPLLCARMSREGELVPVLETWLPVIPASEGTPG